MSLSLESVFTEFWLVQGDLARARLQAQKSVEFALATEERTFQALALEARARVAIAEEELAHAQDCLAKALESMEGYEVPLAHWRVHARASELHRRLGCDKVAEYHRALSCATVRKLADSLPTDNPVRRAFLSAPPILDVLRDIPIS